MGHLCFGGVGVQKAELPPFLFFLILSSTVGLGARLENEPRATDTAEGGSLLGTWPYVFGVGYLFIPVRGPKCCLRLD